MKFYLHFYTMAAYWQADSEVKFAAWLFHWW